MKKILGFDWYELLILLIIIIICAVLTIDNFKEKCAEKKEDIKPNLELKKHSITLKGSDELQLEVNEKGIFEQKKIIKNDRKENEIKIVSGLGADYNCSNVYSVEIIGNNGKKIYADCALGTCHSVYCEWSEVRLKENKDINIMYDFTLCTGRYRGKSKIPNTNYTADELLRRVYGTMAKD